MNFQIGILGINTLGWQLLLEQEGVSFINVDNGFSLLDYSTVIISDDLNDKDVRRVIEYLAKGGAILCSGKMFSRISGFKCSQSLVRYLAERGDSKFAGIGLLDLDKRGCIPVNANCLRTHDGHPAVFCGEYSSGFVVALPFDASAAVMDHRIALKSFYSERHRLPYEEVSRVSKGNLLKLISRSLEILHHLRGIPYMHKWYYPKDYQTIFSWRIDTDYASKQEIQSLYNIIRGYDVPATWFIDVKSQEKNLPLFKKMENQEIGIHCFEHSRFDNRESSILDIRKAVEVLDKHGMTAKSYAAPFGIWNEGMAKVLTKFSFDYSSEFSYDYDNVPSFPIVENSFTQVLQVPVHPISIGNLRRQGFDEKTMCEYFNYILETKLSSRIPAMFYHHPKNNHEGVVRHIFKFAKEHALPMMLMADYAHWWKKRSMMKVGLYFTNQLIMTKCTEQDDNVWFHITRPDGTEAFTPIQSEINLQTIRWRNLPEPTSVPNDIHRVRKFNPWILLQQFEDNIIVKFKRS